MSVRWCLQLRRNRKVFLEPVLDRIDNAFVPVEKPQYALVAYMRNSTGRFVESMRQEVHPDHDHLPAHITILPPRQLSGTEDQAMEMLRQEIPKLDAFSVRLGEVETFFPMTPTVFIRVAKSAHRIREMHDRLNIGPLESAENWPFMPHVTIVKMSELGQAQAALDESRRRWSHFAGSPDVEISELTFVREGEANRWIDLESISLRKPVPTTR
jgi:2'-5' RNA ligase